MELRWHNCLTADKSPLPLSVLATVFRSSQLFHFSRAIRRHLQLVSHVISNNATRFSFCLLQWLQQKVSVAPCWPSVLIECCTYNVLPDRTTTPALTAFSLTRSCSTHEWGPRSEILICRHPQCPFPFPPLHIALARYLLAHQVNTNGALDTICSSVFARRSCLRILHSRLSRRCCGAGVRLHPCLFRQEQRRSTKTRRCQRDSGYRDSTSENRWLYHQESVILVMFRRVPNYLR